MKTVSLLLFVTVTIFSQVRAATDGVTKPIKSLATAKKMLSGVWLLNKGPNSETPSKATTWTFSEGKKIKDSSSPKHDIEFQVLLTESGETWMLMLPYGANDSSPMIMLFKVTSDSLRLDYVGRNSDGDYGASDKGGLTFYRKK